MCLNDVHGITQTGQVLALAYILIYTFKSQQKPTMYMVIVVVIIALTVYQSCYCNPLVTAVLE